MSRGWLLTFILLAPGALAQEPRAALAWTPCAFDASERAFGPRQLDSTRLRCGRLTVPEDRRRPGGRSIGLAFAIVSAEAPVAGAVPLVYVEGGPGLAALGARTFVIEGPLLAVEREVILFDQRGTGRSEPTMCPALATAERNAVAADFSPEEETVARQRAQRACRDELAGQGIDPGSYDLDATVADIEDLRRALGRERWALLGRSYGAAVVQRVMRRHAAAVHSAILVSPVPPDWSNFDEAVPNVARTLGRIYLECAGDANCARAFRDPEADLRQVHRELRERPWTIAVDPARFASPRFTINALDFMTIVDEMLYADWNIPHVPRVLRGFATRDTVVVRAVVEQVFGGPSGLSVAVRNSVWCREAVAGYSRMRWEQQSAPYAPALHDIGRLYLEICDAWPVSTGSLEDRRFIESDIPTLILAGGYDHVTPASKSAALARRLKNSQRVEFPFSSHVIPSSPQTGACAYGLMRAFLTNPGTRLDAACAATLPPLRYATELSGPDLGP